MIGRQTSSINNPADKYVSNDADVAALHRKQLRARKPGRCTLARQGLKVIFHRRRYYYSVIGLTWIEIFFVFIRLILETESLRVQPGAIRESLTKTQLVLACISTLILSYFVMEQPFKWWAFGNRKCWRSLRLVADALVCFACFALNVYTIVMLSSRRSSPLASAKMLDLCGSTHHTQIPDTQATFALASGIIIVYRLWCISPYIDKCIQKAVAASRQQVSALKYALDEADHMINQIENRGGAPNPGGYPPINTQQVPQRSGYPEENARPQGSITSSQRGNQRYSGRP